MASEDFNKEWAEYLGVDLTRVVLAQTNVMEEAYEIMLDGPRRASRSTPSSSTPTPP